MASCSPFVGKPAEPSVVFLFGTGSRHRDPAVPVPNTESRTDASHAVSQRVGQEHLSVTSQLPCPAGFPMARPLPLSAP